MFLLLSNRLIDDQGQLYEDLLKETNDDNVLICLHQSRLQQLENQLKQCSNEKKEEKLKEIVHFIEEKLLPFFDEEAIWKFYGQKNSSSNEKEILNIRRFLSTFSSSSSFQSFHCFI